MKTKHCFPARCSRKDDGGDLEGEKTADSGGKEQYIYIYIYVCVCVCVCARSNTGFKKGKQLE